MAYIRFHKALKHQNIDRNSLLFKSPFQPYLAIGGASFFAMVLIFNGFAVFTRGNWNAQNFVSAYIGMPPFALFFVGWKVLKKTRIVPIAEIDLISGRVEETAYAAPAVARSKPIDIIRKISSKIF